MELYQHQHTVKPFTVQQHSDAINQLERGKGGVNVEMIKYSTRRLRNTCYDCRTRPSNRTSNHHQTCGTRCSKLYTRAGSSTNSLASSSSNADNPCWTSTGHRVTPGSQPWASKQHSTRWNTVAYGRLYGCKALRNHTYSDSQSYTTSNEQQCTLTTSSGEPRRETHSLSTLLFNSFLRYIMKPLTDRWKQR